MNDLSNNPPAPPANANPDPNSGDSTTSAGNSDKTKGSSPNSLDGRSMNVIYAALVGLTVMVLIHWWSSTDQITQLREELARRLQAADVNSAEAKTIAKSLFETTKELQVKVGVLESKLVESESHSLALEQLYQDLSKSRDEWALSEIEQVLSTASQQLQLAGNVQGALIALQNADARLARSDKPQFIMVRRAIAHDIDRLKRLPNLDLAGIVLRLDSVIAQIDNMPLLVSESPVTVASSVGASASKKSPSIQKTNTEKVHTQNENGSAGWKQWLSMRWHSLVTNMWEQTRQLIRIRNVDNPDALMLAPNQGYFVKENVKLRLLNARMALLSRNEALFKNDIVAVQHEITRYFDTSAKQTQAVQNLLRQIQNSNLSIEMPSLTESLNAVRNFTVKQ